MAAIVGPERTVVEPYERYRAAARFLESTRRAGEVARLLHVNEAMEVLLTDWRPENKPTGVGQPNRTRDARAHRSAVAKHGRGPGPAFSAAKGPIRWRLDPIVAGAVEGRLSSLIDKETRRLLPRRRAIREASFMIQQLGRARVQASRKESQTPELECHQPWVAQWHAAVSSGSIADQQAAEALAAGAEARGWDASYPRHWPRQGIA